MSDPFAAPQKKPDRYLLFMKTVHTDQADPNGKHRHMTVRA